MDSESQAVLIGMGADLLAALVILAGLGIATAAAMFVCIKGVHLLYNLVTPGRYWDSY